MPFTVKLDGDVSLFVSVPVKPIIAEPSGASAALQDSLFAVT